MRIAFVYDMVYPFKIGGVEKRIWEISWRLAANGHEVHLYSLKLWEGPPDFIRKGVHIHGVGRKLPFHTGESGRRAVFPALWFSMALFFPFLRGGRFDVVDCQNFPYFHCFPVKVVSYLRKSPLLITWHEVWGSYWFEYMGSTGMIGIAIEKLVGYLSACNVAVSETTREQLRATGIKGSIFIVPNGVDFEKIRPIPPSSTRSDVIFSGRLIRDKHVDVLIGALGFLHKSYPDLKCTIIGRGPEEERLKAQVISENLEKNVEFVGFLKDPDDLIGLMKSSRVCVLPSTREGFGIVALEARACGIPVVTSDHPGNAIRDLAAIGGVRIVPLTREDFAHAIEDMLSSFSAPEPASLEGAWDWDAVTRKWLAVAGDLATPAGIRTTKGSL